MAWVNPRYKELTGADSPDRADATLADVRRAFEAHRGVGPATGHAHEVRGGRVSRDSYDSNPCISARLAQRLKQLASERGTQP